jgi:hypothetical protein
MGSSATTDLAPNEKGNWVERSKGRSSVLIALRSGRIRDEKNVGLVTGLES